MIEDYFTTIKKRGYEIDPRNKLVPLFLELAKPDKNGRKNNPRVMNTRTQRVDDFQPLSKAANDAKRQHCKECKATGNRFDAKRLGYIISYYKGDKVHSNNYDGCIGCFWYDPIEFRKYLKSI